MAFDPDAYLASKSGSGEFDPVAYLRGKAIEDKRAKLQAGVEHARLAAQEAEAGGPSLPREIGAGLLNQVRTVGNAASGLADVVRHPVLTLTDAARRRQLERGVADVVTGGMATKAADALIRATGGHETFAGTEQADEQAAPNLRSLGEVGGMFLPSPVNAAVKGAARGARIAVPGSGVAMGAARGAVTGLAAAPAVTTIQAAMRGDNPLDAIDLAQNLTSGAMGAASGAVGGGAQKYAQETRDPRTLSGRVLRDVEAAGGEPGLRQPVSGGLYDDPELTSLPQGRAGVNMAARQQRDNIVASNRAKLARARKDFGESVDEILGEHGDTHHLVEATHAKLGDLESENTVNGVAGDEHLAKAIGKIRQMLTKDTGVLDVDSTRASGEPEYITAPAVKVDDFVKVKKIVNKLADWKDRPSAENRPYRLISGALDEDARGIDPRIAEMNVAYKKALQPLEETNDVLFGKRKPDVTVGAAKAKGAALKLGRVGDETQAGTTDDLDRLRGLSPETDRALRIVAAKKAQERLRFGAPEVSTSIEKGMNNAVGRHMASKAGAAVGATLGGLPGAFVGHGLGQFREAMQTPAGRIRVGLPIADMLQDMEPAARMRVLMLLNASPQAQRDSP